MLFTVTTTHRPATDLGFLLHKHPDSHQVFDLPSGAAHVFYPEAGEERCTAALLLSVDPIALEVFGTAMSGRCRQRPGLAASAIPLVARLSALPSIGREPTLRRLFEPLGYEVAVTSHPLDERFPEWGLARHLTVELRRCASQSCSHSCTS